MSPALAGRFLSTKPPGKPLDFLLVFFNSLTSLLGVFKVHNPINKEMTECFILECCAAERKNELELSVSIKLFHVVVFSEEKSEHAATTRSRLLQQTSILCAMAKNRYSHIHK